MGFGPFFGDYDYGAQLKELLGLEEVFGRNMLTDPLGDVKAAEAQAEAQKEALDANERIATSTRDWLTDRSDLGIGYIRGAAGQGAGALNKGYGQARRDLDSGRLGSMLDQPGGLYGGFEQDPGYQFRLQQGQQALDRQSAARGGRGGTRAMEAMAQFNQGLASQEYGNYAARRQAEAGLASGVDQGLAGMSANYGSSLADLYSNTGANMANAAIGASGQGTSLSQQLMAAHNNYANSGGMVQQAQANSNRDAAMTVAAMA